jgi:hypothetical protein
MLSTIAPVDEDQPKTRRREPRVRDNPMAVIVHAVMVEAERAFGRADALAADMEAHLLKRVTNSAIYSYTNDRDDRKVPPADVLLAAARAADISLDEKLGITRRARDLADMRAEIAELREEVAGLRAEVADRGDTPAPDDAEAARAARAARRRELVRRSEAGQPSPQPPPRTRPTRRQSGI